MTISASFDLHEGMAMRKRIAFSWRRNVTSIFGLDVENAEREGK